MAGTDLPVQSEKAPRAERLEVEEKGMIMLDTFASGGIWMWVISVMGVVYYSLLVAQFVKVKRADFTLALLGVLVALALIGPLGTYVGLHQAGLAIGNQPPEQSASLLGQALGIAHVTSAYAFLLAIPGAIALGIAASKVRRHAAARVAQG